MALDTKVLARPPRSGTARLHRKQCLYSIVRGSICTPQPDYIEARARVCARLQPGLNAYEVTRAGDRGALYAEGPAHVNVGASLGQEAFSAGTSQSPLLAGGPPREDGSARAELDLDAAEPECYSPEPWCCQSAVRLHWSFGPLAYSPLLGWIVGCFARTKNRG